MRSLEVRYLNDPAAFHGPNTFSEGATAFSGRDGHSQDHLCRNARAVRAPFQSDASVDGSMRNDCDAERKANGDGGPAKPIAGAHTQHPAQYPASGPPG